MKDTMDIDVLILTDARGRVFKGTDVSEPLPASVVLVDGEWGHAFQRHFDDGLWHPVRSRGRARDWGWILTKRNVVLVYDAAPRPTPVQQWGRGKP